MGFDAEFSLTFDGARAERSEIDLYDVAYALIGFQRSLALTTHLVLNDQIITQSPSLKGAVIVARPPETGSWKIMTGLTIVATGLFQLGTAPKDTPIGHLVYSAYDYVVKESLGVHVDFNKSLGQQYEELQAQGFKGHVLTESKMDSLIEKCETAIKEIHRPIFGEETATSANIAAHISGKTLPVGVLLDIGTFDYLRETIRDTSEANLVGRVTSYNSNTFKGRVFVLSEGRPVPFELMPAARGTDALTAITQSLSMNTLYPRNRKLGFFEFSAVPKRSRTGIIKSLEVESVDRSKMMVAP